MATGVASLSFKGLRWIVTDKDPKLQRFNDGEDDVRDLVALGVEDGGDTLDFVIKPRELKPSKSTAYYLLFDFNRLDGRFTLPDGIKGATDHPWDLAVKVEYGDEPRGEVLWGLSTKPELSGVDDPSHILAGVQVDEARGALRVKLLKRLLERIGMYPSSTFYVQALSANTKRRRIADSFNYPKPWENANFLVGAYPVMKMTAGRRNGDAPRRIK